ncbi:MAG: HrcA family transcriptional regulator [Trueperaceae bacterium]
MRERAARILNLVADRYVRTARPVPSATVAAELDVSSATVRSAFGVLEDEGLLHQPHTSAGRIPTPLGFRRYADAFLPPEPLPPIALAVLQRRLAGAHGDALLQQLAQVAAELSGYAVVVRVPTDPHVHALEIHLSLLHARALLAVVVLADGFVRQVRVDVDPSPADDVLGSAERHLRQLTLPVAEVPHALAALAAQAEPELARTLRAIHDAWPAVAPPRIVSAGLSNVLNEPEAHDPAFVRLVVDRVERPTTTGPLDDGLRLDWDQGLAAVATRWSDGLDGTLTLVGPARLRYGRALQVVGGVAQAVRDGPTPA